LGVAAFCRHKSVSTSSFYGWRQKLDRPARLGAAKPGVARSPGRERATFVPVKLAAAQTRSPSPVMESLSDPEDEPLTVVLRNGRRLLLKQGFDPRLLQLSWGAQTRHGLSF